MTQENKHGNSDDHRQDMVTIIVDKKPREIHRGSQTVSEIKRVGEVDPTWRIEQKKDGKWELLPDDDRVVIKGGEEFRSHQETAGGS